MSCDNNGNYTENLPTPGYFLGVPILFDRDVAERSGLCSVAMRETLYAEVDLTDAVVDLVKQGHYSAVSVVIFGPTHPSNPKPGHHCLPNRCDKTA